MIQTEQLLSELQTDYQRRLEESERKFKYLVRYGSDMMCILDADITCTYVPDPSKRVLGYSAGYFLGKNLEHFIHPADLPVVLSEIRALDPDVYKEMSPYRFMAASGEWRWMESKMMNMIGDPAVNGLVVTSRDVTDKKREDSERRMETEKRHKQITRAIVKAQEKERQSIGNELHDNVNQLLTTVKLYLVMVRDNAESRDSLMPKVIGLVQDCIQEIRYLSNRLVSPHQSDLGLTEAVRELIDSIALSGALHLNYHPEKMENIDIAEEIQLTVYRVVQEQLTNIIRHAQATRVDIYLETRGRELLLVITDDGQGFDIGHAKKGMGILNMYNRAETVGGELDITSFPGQGCTLSGSFPVDIPGG